METLDPYMIEQLSVVMQLALLGIGIAQTVDQVYNKDWRAVTKIGACVLGLGVVAGILDGVTVMQGVLIGFQASGLIAFASYIGKKAQG